VGRNRAKSEVTKPLRGSTILRGSTDSSLSRTEVRIRRKQTSEALNRKAGLKPVVDLTRVCVTEVTEHRDRFGSFPLDVGRLDNRPPLLDFGLVEDAESFGRLLIARIYVLSNFCKLLANHRIR
jgi:hypothetical protein